MLSRDVLRLLPAGAAVLAVGVLWIATGPGAAPVRWAGAAAPLLPWLAPGCVVVFLASQLLLVRGLPGPAKGGPRLTVMDAIWLAAPVLLVAGVGIWLGTAPGTAGR